MAGPDFDAILADLSARSPGALEEAERGRREAVGMNREALAAYQATLNQKQRGDPAMMAFFGALGRPTTSGSGAEGLGAAMESYAGALERAETRNMSKAEKLASIMQAQATLRESEGGIGWRRMQDSIAAAKGMSEVDQQAQKARFLREMGGGPGAMGGAPAAAPASSLANVAAGNSPLEVATNQAAQTGAPPQMGGSSSILPPSAFPAPGDSPFDPRPAMPQMAQNGPQATPAAQAAPAATAWPEGAYKLKPEQMRVAQQAQHLINVGTRNITMSEGQQALQRGQQLMKSILGSDNYNVNMEEGYAYPVGDARPEYIKMKAQAARAEQPRSASDNKAILEADEAVVADEGVLTSLGKASTVSRQAYGNPVGAFYSNVGQFFGDEAAQNTVDLKNLTTGQALQQLKTTFGAAPTEGERKILLEIQGSANLPDAQRQKIFERAKEATEKRLAFRRQQAEQLRGGTYYKPGGGPSSATKPSPAQSSGADPLEAAMRARGFIP